MKVVLDASAALAAILGRPPASGILDVLTDASTVLAPDLFASEVANALWKYVEAGEITGTQAADDLESALNLVERFVPVVTLAQEALREASVYGHPVYDLGYAIAARREGCSVLTLDTRLQRLLARMKIAAVVTKQMRS